MAINDAKAAADLADLAMESNDAAALLEGDRARHRLEANPYPESRPRSV
jgi:hypothetical protein